ncbi:FCS-Like Zinc finger 17-like [Magnolia sinica]|uniref:FCS-Like Zinc finger 17-like n=1 Tax=Magnolia sinica TaxID=86752 RepID=UPI00265857D1|nr:FCS-Like Zinc finger 17-like [Magnolia sinica]
MMKKMREDGPPSKAHQCATGEMNGSDPTSSCPVGLRLLIQSSGRESNVINKSVSILTKSVHPNRRIPSSFPESSFLKACQLCKKELTPLDDVYMYRGDQGFCSVKCRCRQIFIDEMREMEASARGPPAPPLRSNRGRRMPKSNRCGGILAVG